MSRPYLSVVIPAYNEEKYLPLCLAALKKQAFTNFETIVVVQGTDQTAKIAKTWGCRVIRQATPSISLARHTGFAAAKGEIIVSTDADAIPSPAWLSSIANCLSSTELSAVTGPIIHSSTKLGVKIMNVLLKFNFFFWRQVGYVIVYGNNFAVKKSAYHQTSGFDPRLHIFEDMDTGDKIRRIGKIHYCPSAKVYVSARRLEKLGIFRFTYTQIRDNLIYLLFKQTRSDYETIR